MGVGMGMRTWLASWRVLHGEGPESERTEEAALLQELGSDLVPIACSGAPRPAECTSAGVDGSLLCPCYRCLGFSLRVRLANRTGVEL